MLCNDISYFRTSAAAMTRVTGASRAQCSMSSASQMMLRRRTTSRAPRGVWEALVYALALRRIRDTARANSSPYCRALLHERQESFGCFGRLSLARVNFDEAVEFRLVQTAPSRLHRECLGLGDRVRSILQYLINDPRAGRF